MLQRWGDPIRVAAIFGSSSTMKPVWFIWDGRHYQINKITYQWNTREGVATLRHFSVTDRAGNYYELCFHPSSVTWYLATCEASG